MSGPDAGQSNGNSRMELAVVPSPGSAIEKSTNSAVPADESIHALATTSMHPAFEGLNREQREAYFDTIIDNRRALQDPAAQEFLNRIQEHFGMGDDGLVVSARVSDLMVKAEESARELAASSSPLAEAEELRMFAAYNWAINEVVVETGSYGPHREWTANVLGRAGQFEQQEIDLLKFASRELLAQYRVGGDEYDPTGLEARLCTTLQQNKFATLAKQDGDDRNAHIDLLERRVREVMGDLASGEEVGNLIEQYRLLMREVLRSPNPWGSSQSEFQGSGIRGGSDPSSALGGGSPDPRDGSPNERDPDGGDPGDGDPGGGGAGGPGGPEGPGRGDSPGQDPERPEYFQQQVEGVRQLLLREGLSDICPEPLVEVEIGGRRYRGGVLEAVALCASRYASGDVLAYRELQAITNSFNAHFDRIINLEKLANREPSAALEEMIHAYDDKLADCLEAGLGRLLGGSGMSLLGSLKGRTIEARRTSGVPASEQDSGIETLTAAFVSAAQYVQQAKVHSVPEGEIRSQLDDFYEQVKRLGAYTRTNLQEERDRERRLLSEFKEDLMRRT